MKIELRPARPGDAHLMHQISLRAWQGRVAANSSLYAETVDYVAQILTRGGGLLLLVDQQLAGSVRYFPLDHAPDCWEIKRLGVIAPYRKLGLGVTMMNAVHEQAVRSGVARLQLGIRADQPRLISFYQDLGYELDDSVQLSAHNPQTAPAITMSRKVISS